ncbi:Stk1 family PASTA domain-containing Ser/Thr kinase [Lactococcus garvieae]|uniref:non-specific serine/threonine protein kinase n=1 Tax=Lactococcus garvieae TaxID=1363 RepID=A0AA43PIN3_9LACT|nr:Stk1 family PASTA domain-containing Ser/Thr kinase [Lactococcus garvieae]MDH7960418.1 Stk1 family PASTA domain-containing Ser/Thr kinase [Lactococcus garvieae]BDM76684.1 putative serine/threonine-protein kinase PknB [Lactococcus garvieae]BDW51951.1 putative serine/threonine-protein kinase PknB [Lactococcus garvieae]
MIQIGKIFADRYKIIKEVGRGGMANVYQGEDTYLDNRQVAIKVLRSNFENDNIAIARFQREAFAMAELSHPNIVSISDVGESENQQYIVMEYVDGMTLKQYINEHAPLSNDEAVNITSEILSAMECAHNHGIIHRDLKPQNVLLSQSGNVKVTDFGIAKALTETSLTQTNTMFGSVHYLSPEQARGANATLQSDIYAIGIILFELLTGQIPFDGDSAVAIALKHFQENVPSIININKNVPQALENVVIKATAKDINNRYANVEEMMTDLATATSLDRKGEPKLTFDKDLDATKALPSKLINPYDTKPLIDHSQSEQKDEAKDKATEDKAQADSEQKKKKSRKRLIAWIILALVLIAGGVTAWMITTPQNVSVPDVTNMTQAEAESKLKEKNLAVGNIIPELSTTVEKDKVTRTNPESGSNVRKNSKVDIYVSQGATGFKMDDYVGQKYEDVVDELVLNKNISKSQIKVNYVTSSEDSGTIVKQTPAKGEFFDPTGNDQITFDVSEGETVIMPALALTSGGLSSTSAISYLNQLESLGVPTSNITFVDASTASKVSSSNLDGYYVTQTSPESGKEFNPSNTKITLTVAKASNGNTGGNQTPETTTETTPETTPATTPETTPATSPEQGKDSSNQEKDSSSNNGNTNSTTEQSS